MPKLTITVEYPNDGVFTTLRHAVVGAAEEAVDDFCDEHDVPEKLSNNIDFGWDVDE